MRVDAATSGFGFLWLFQCFRGLGAGPGAVQEVAVVELIHRFLQDLQPHT